MTACPVKPPLPMLLGRDEVRAALDQGHVTLRRMVRARSDRQPNVNRYGRPGDRLWVRERFSTRQDGVWIKVRYPADGAQGQARLIPIAQVEPKYWTRSYVTREAKYMPRWASRITLAVVAVEPEERGHVRIRAKLESVAE